MTRFILCRVGPKFLNLKVTLLLTFPLLVVSMNFFLQTILFSFMRGVKKTANLSGGGGGRGSFFILQHANFVLLIGEGQGEGGDMVAFQFACF